MADAALTGSVQNNALAVDMDGTLFLTDTLYEGFFRALFHSPREALSALLALPRGRAAVKMAIRERSREGVATYPVRQDLLIWLTEQSDAGRPLYLVTAADRAVAEEAAKRFGFFRGVIATSDKINLKGPNKRLALDDQFAGNWSYVGDSSADIPVFAGAQSVVLAGHKPKLSGAVARIGKQVEAEFPRHTTTLSDWLKGLRIHQWAKNLLMFIPLILSGSFLQPPEVLQALAAFLLMGLCASGTYVLNDLSDLHADRAHLTKRHRPFASVRIPIAQAFIVAVGLIVGSLVVATMLSVKFGMLLALYTATTLGYSLKLKRYTMIDVSALACLYTLRLAMGAAVVGVPLSGWLAAFSLAFFLSLSLAKRQTEIAKAAQQGRSGRLAGRGYRVEDGPLVLAFGAASGMVALLLMVLFLVFQAFEQSGYREPEILLAAPMLAFLWLSRVWLFAARGELEDDPVVFAVRDRPSLFVGVLMILSAMLAVVGTPL